MIRKILVAIDDSAHAHAVLECAVELAQRYQASPCLLHAFAHVSDLLGHPDYELLLDTRTLVGQTLLDEARTEIGDNVAVEMQLIEGPPAQALLHVAADESYDMIVMGSRGHGRIASLLMGCVSHAVAQQATCPVVIVR